MTYSHDRLARERREQGQATKSWLRPRYRGGWTKAKGKVEESQIHTTPCSASQTPWMPFRLHERPSEILRKLDLPMKFTEHMYKEDVKRVANDPSNSYFATGLGHGSTKLKSFLTTEAVMWRRVFHRDIDRKLAKVIACCPDDHTTAIHLHQKAFSWFIFSWIINSAKSPFSGYSDSDSIRRSRNGSSFLSSRRLWWILRRRIWTQTRESAS